MNTTSGTNNNTGTMMFRCGRYELIPENETIAEKLRGSALYQTCGCNESTPGYCPEAFDKVFYTRLSGEVCWPESPPNSTLYLHCPKFGGFDTSRMTHKQCLENGSWFFSGENLTHYLDCVDMEEYEFMSLINRFHVAGYAISLIALIISMWIFLSFRSLRCTRIRIHTQLFASFILNNILWIIWYEHIVPDLDVTSSNPLWCQILHVFKEYAMIANYMWMLCEGLHLHLALVVVFVREERTMKWFLAIGWGIPVIIVLVHTYVRLYITEDTKTCWMEESPSSTWFLSIPVIIILILCTIFLINVLRVILTIMHPNSHNPAPVGMRRAVRAAMILIPLFGLQFILLPMIPEKDHPLYHFYMILSVIIIPFQGLVCACLFCFANQDVIQAVKGFLLRSTHHCNTRWSNYRYTGDSGAGVFIVNGITTHRKSTDTTRL